MRRPIGIGLTVLVLGGVLAIGFLVGGDRPPGELAPIPEGCSTQPAPGEPTASPTLRGDGRSTTSAEPSPGEDTIEGLVLDEDAVPVEGIVVAAWRARFAAEPAGLLGPLEAAAGDGDPVTTTRTDASGRFVLGDLDAGDERGFFRVRACPGPPAFGTEAVGTPEEGRLSSSCVLRVVRGVPLALRVVDREGRGLLAAVRLQGLRPIRPARGPPGETRWRMDERWTDADGRLDIEAVPDMALVLRVRVAGRVALDGIRLRPPFEGVVVFCVDVAAQSAVAGWVRDVAGDPVAGARVAVRVRRVRDHATVTTAGVSGPDGTYRLDIPAGTLLDLHAAAEGFVDSCLDDFGRDVAAGDTVAVNVTLLRGGTVEGRVLDEDGKGIAGASAMLRLDGRRFVRTVATDATGHWRFEDVPPGHHRVRAAKEGWWASRDTSPGVGRPDRWTRPGEPPECVVRLEDDGGAAEIDLVLRRGIPVAGVVRDEKGRLVAHARVRVDSEVSVVPSRSSRMRFGGAARATCSADGEGRFRFPGLMPSHQEVRLWAWTEGRASEPLSVTVHPETAERLLAIDLILKSTASIAGRVLRADGEPAAHSLLLLQPDLLVRTDGAGYFGIEGLAAGTYQILSARSPAVVLWRDPVDWGQEIEGLDLRLPSTFEVTGVVVDGMGRPVRDAPIWFQSESGSTLRREWTDDAGAFRIGGVADGTYRVRVDGILLEETVEAGTSGVRLVRPAHTARVAERVVEGTVFDPVGRPLTRGVVSVAFLVGGQGRGTTSRRGRIFDGYFRLRFETDTDAEYVTLVVSDARDRLGRPIAIEPFRLEDVAIAESPFEIRLNTPGIVAGCVVDEDGCGVPGIRVMVTVGDFVSRGHRGREASAQTDTEGRFRFEGLVRGPVEIAVSPPPAFRRGPSIWATTGDTDVIVRLERGAAITGCVLTEDGSPAAGVPLGAMPASHPQGAWGHAVSGEDGTFVLEGLDHDTTYTVRTEFDPSGRRPDLLRNLVRDVPPDATDVVLVARRGCYVEGEVLRPDGRPAAGASLWTAPVAPAWDAEGKGHAMADGTGHFRMGPIAPGRYRLQAHLPALGRSPEMEVDAPVVGVRIVLPLRLQRRGRIVGQDVANFRITWMAADGDRGDLGGTRTDRDGSFVMGGLRDRAYAVYAWRPDDDRYALTEEVRPSEEDLDLVLANGLAIRGRVDAPSEQRFAVWVHAVSRAHGFQRHAPVADNGTFVFRGLPPGRYVVRFAGTDAETPPPAVEVAAGDDDVVVPGT